MAALYFVYMLLIVFLFEDAWFWTVRHDTLIPAFEHICREQCESSREMGPLLPFPKKAAQYEFHRLELIGTPVLMNNVILLPALLSLTPSKSHMEPKDANFLSKCHLIISRIHLIILSNHIQPFFKFLDEFPCSILAWFPPHLLSTPWGPGGCTAISCKRCQR